MQETAPNNIENIIIRYVLGECSESERAQAELLLQSDAIAQQHYSVYSKLYAHAPDKKHTKRFNTEAAIARFHAETQTSVKTKKGKTLPLIVTISSIAASIIAVAGFLFLNSNNHSAVYTSIVAGIDTAHYKLADGSQLTLNSGSAVTYSFDDPHKRFVTLDSGEVFFSVAKDIDRPFTIKTRAVKVTVLGTKFNINSRSQDSVVVSVVEGVVAVQIENDTTNRVILHAGDAVAFHDSTNKFVSHENAVQNDLFWKTRTLEFRNAFYADFIPVLEHEYDITISYPADSVSNCKLSARFSNQPIAAVMEILSMTLSVDIEITPEGYRISPLADCK